MKAEAQLVSRNELRYFFATRSNQTIYYARVMDSRPPDANAMLEYASHCQIVRRRSLAG